MSEEQINKSDENITPPNPPELVISEGNNNVNDSGVNPTNEQPTANEAQNHQHKTEAILVEIKKQKWSTSETINIIIAAGTVFAVFISAYSLKISNDSLELTRASIDSANKSSQQSYELTKKSVESGATVANASKKTASISDSNYQLTKTAIENSDINSKKSVYISEQSLKGSQSAFKETVKQFEAEYAPYLQTVDVELSPIKVNEKLALSFSLNNLRETPVKIISFKVAFNITRPVKYNELKNGDEINKNNMYVIKEIPMDVKTVLAERLSVADSIWLENKDNYIYYAREIQYINMITGRPRIYRFQIKIRHLIGSKLFPRNTYFEFIENENENK